MRICLPLFLLLVTFSWAGCAHPRVDSAVIVVVDTMRADVLGVAGYSRSTTPEIDRWAREARIYENAYSSSPWTLPAFGTLLTGTWPANHTAGVKGSREGGRSKFSRLSTSVPTLGELLSNAGLSTAAFVNNSFLASRFGVSRGFDVWDFHPGSRDGYRPADEVVDRALAWLRRHRRDRYLLLVHLFDPHLPYGAPEPYLDRWGGAMAQDEVRRPLEEIRTRLRTEATAMIDTFRAAYDEEVRFVDSQVGRLLEGLDQLELSRRTMVILTADHGEEFLDHGGFEHGHTLFDELLRVPLIVDVPGQSAGRITDPVSLADVAPTVLDGLGLSKSDGVSGVSLLRSRPNEERALVAEDLLYGAQGRTVIRWPWKLIDRGGDKRLFRLDRDPGETRDVALGRPDVVTSLTEELVAAAESADGEGQAVELDEETEESLRSLGYVD